MEQKPEHLSIIRIQELAKRLSCGKSTIWDWLDEGSKRYNPAFPKPVRIGAASTGWISSEIDQYILDLAEQRRKGGGDAAD